MSDFEERAERMAGERKDPRPLAAFIASHRDDGINFPTRITVPADQLHGWAGFDSSKPGGPASQYAERGAEMIRAMQELARDHEEATAREHQTIVVPAAREQVVRALIDAYGAADRFAVTVLPGMPDNKIYVIRDGLLDEWLRSYPQGPS